MPHAVLVPAAAERQAPGMSRRPLAPIALALALLPLACSGPKKPADEQSGAELYATYCKSCHGKQGRGSFLNLGPSYEGLAQHWTAENLLEYIADPKTFAAADERLGEREMPAIDPNVSMEARRRLVEHALGLMD